MDVISQETQAWWNRDYEMWSNSWHHAPYISWNGTTNVMHLEYLGWDALSKFTQESFKKYPDPNLSKVERSDWQFRIYKKGAWVRFTQKGEGTSREVRILEKHKGKWKIVHVGWIDESSFEKG